MKRNDALKILNPVLETLVLYQALTGMLHHEIPFTIFGIIHRAGGVLLVAAAVTHLTLNWNWVQATYFKRAPGIKK